MFFHPRFEFRDGQARNTLQGSAPNYVRRSPWPMVALLRASQVRAARRDVPAGLVHAQNEAKLTSIGAVALEVKLRRYVHALVS
jgi:hypothetical protein